MLKAYITYYFKYIHGHLISLRYFKSAAGTGSSSQHVIQGKYEEEWADNIGRPAKESLAKAWCSD